MWIRTVNRCFSPRLFAECFTQAFKRLSMSSSLVKVTVKLFAAYQEAYGVPELTLEFPKGTTVRAVRDCLIDEYPQLEQWRQVTRFGINLQFVEEDTPLNDGDEVVLIPPVSGG